MSFSRQKDAAREGRAQQHIRHDAPYNVLEGQDHLGNNLSTGSGNTGLRSPSSADTLLRHALKNPRTMPLSEYDAAMWNSPYRDVKPKSPGESSFSMIQFAAPRQENPTSGVSFVAPYRAPGEAETRKHPEPPSHPDH